MSPPAAAAAAAAASLLPAPLAAFLAWHRRQLVERPYLANSATSAALMLLGDRFAQGVEARRDSRAAIGCADAAQPPGLSAHASAVRSGVLTVWAASASLVWTRWYLFIFKRWPGRVLLWTGLTAAVPAPIMNAAFFSFSTVGEHLFAHEAPLAPEQRAECMSVLCRKLETQLAPTVLRSATLWMPVNIVNFYLVPLEYRMLAGSSVSFLWNIYLSLVQHEHHAPGSGNSGAAIVAAAAAGEAVR
jgi:hypothetical protein